MPNILHLINTAGPGGAETVFENIVRYLPADRWTSTTVVRNEGWLPDRLRAAGHEPVILGSRSRLDFSYYSMLRDVIRSRTIDLIHTHYFGPAITGSVLGLLCGIPAVSTLHGTGDLSPTESFRRLKLNVLRRGTDRVVFVSAPLRDFYVPLLGLEERSAVVIPNGVEPHFFETRRRGALRSEIGSRPDDFLLGSVGNLRPAKGYDVLLRAVAELRSELPSVRLVIAGDGEGPLLDELLALRAELGLVEHVHFLGFRPDVQDVLADLDLFVVSSRTEGFSLAAVQAMAAGLPVVATKSGGPEMILEHGRTGILVDAGSAQALAGAIRDLHGKRSERQQLARAGRRHAAEQFTVEQQVRAYEQLYEDCLGAGTRGKTATRVEPRQGVVA